MTGTVKKLTTTANGSHMATIAKTDPPPADDIEIVVEDWVYDQLLAAGAGGLTVEIHHDEGGDIVGVSLTK